VSRSCPGSGRSPNRKPGWDDRGKLLCPVCGERVAIYLRRLDWSMPHHLMYANHERPVILPIDPTLRTLNRDQANAVFNILVAECDAHEGDRALFLHWAEHNIETREFRFIGSLGFGGKFRVGYRTWYVDCYPEDDTLRRQNSVAGANRRLATLRERALAAALQEAKGTRE
jgi:hypothetical protein